MMPKKLTFLLFLALLGLCFSTTLLADVVVSCLDHEFTLKGEGDAGVASDFEGTLIVTKPDGDILFLETGDEVPELPSGSRLEVFEGKFSVNNGPNAVEVVANPKNGSVEVQEGQIEVLTKEGTVKNLSKGDKFEMNLSGFSETPADPTAASRDLGGTPVEGFGDPDSTNIVQSPSQ